MKKSNFPYFVFVFINIAIALSCYFYPPMRDAFYYLDTVNYPNVFAEYSQAYFHGNPRIGQFFANLISRSEVLKIIFALLLFNGFIAVLYLNIFRKFPNFKEVSNMKSYLKLAAFFIFFISYFGEMFYYTPFSTNYTLTHLFFLGAVFILNEYFIRENTQILSKISFFIFIFFGFFIGMSNEHVPPVLLMVSGLFGLMYLIQKKKLPHLKIIIFGVFILMGYAFLFFSPANSEKQKVVGKSPFDITFNEYFANVFKIIKMYFYYNIELVILGVVAAFLFLIFKNKRPINWQKNTIFYGLLFVFPILIIAVSPLMGTRLVFFSNSILIVVIYQFLVSIFSSKYSNISLPISYLFLMVFFLGSFFMIFKANQDYLSLTTEIIQKREVDKNVVLKHELNYYTDELGNKINRKIFVESGKDYLNQDAKIDNSMEKNLIDYYHLKSLKEK